MSTLARSLLSLSVLLLSLQLASPLLAQPELLKEVSVGVLDTGMAVNRLLEWLITQGPFAVLLVLVWYFYIKPRLEADVQRVKDETAANVERLRVEAECSKRNSESLAQIAAAMQAVNETHAEHKGELRRYSKYIVTAIRAGQEGHQEELRTSLSALEALMLQ